jgi:prepilin-type N-terminal cleavage/methylation domain-containing protein
MNWKWEIRNWKSPRHGFTLMEVLVTVAVILILIGALIGTGSYVKTRAQIDLTKGMLAVLSSALEQYYDNTGDFPPQLADTSGFETFLGLSAGDVTLNIPVPDGGDGFSSAALFWFLDRNPASRGIASAVANTLITNKDASGTAITITIGTNPPIDLPRYIDAWGTSIRYVYLTGTAFPTLTSAGPDKVFDTPDDITSK